MAENICLRCGTPLVMIDQIRIKPAFLGGGREVVQQAAPCQVCAKQQEEELEHIQQQRLWREVMRNSGIPENCWKLGLAPERWKEHRLEVDPGNARQIEQLRRWVDADNVGCAITGTQGLGKTLLALCAGVDCMRRGQHVLFVTERDLLDSFRGRKGDKDLPYLAREAEVLILDDIGRHQIDRGGKFMLEVYLDLFDCRLPVFGPPMKTLLTTQHDAASLARSCADDALASRLMAIVGGNFIELGGRDRRRARWHVNRLSAGDV